MIFREESRVRKKTYSQLYQQSRRIMYNAGRQYGLGTDRQRSIRDRTKSIMERYGIRIDSYFSKEELISMEISLFLAAYIWVIIMDD